MYLYFIRKDSMWLANYMRKSQLVYHRGPATSNTPVCLFSQDRRDALPFQYAVAADLLAKEIGGCVVIKLRKEGT